MTTYNTYNFRLSHRWPPPSPTTTPPLVGSPSQLQQIWAVAGLCHSHSCPAKSVSWPYLLPCPHPWPHPRCPLPTKLWHGRLSESWPWPGYYPAVPDWHRTEVGPIRYLFNLGLTWQPSRIPFYAKFRSLLFFNIQDFIHWSITKTGLKYWKHDTIRSQHIKRGNKLLWS